MAERPGVSGDGVAAQLALMLRPHRSNANQHLVIIHYSLVSGAKLANRGRDTRALQARRAFCHAGVKKWLVA
jgi:hypothetical protein